MGDYLRERKRRSVGIVAASDDLEIRGDGAEIVVCLAIGEVSEAEGLTDFAWCEKLLKLLRDVNCSIWDMEIANYENESGGHGGGFLVGG